jgi:lipopolysaccharide/colanic/teichoic acid biosynthesis glycosyltransferase
MIEDRLNHNPGQNEYLSLYKRYFDFIIATISIIITSPIMLLAAAAIKFSSKGPIFFRQFRVGLNGRIFSCYKFRTMDDALNYSENHRPSDSDLIRLGILDKTKNDKRITKVGSILRKTSIDELPQLFNVLTGEMSIIGPRPLIPFMLEPFPDLKQIRCTVLPGITGLWQVKGRGKNRTVLDMINYDLEYIAHVSFTVDIKILLLTIPALFKTDEAY